MAARIGSLFHQGGKIWANGYGSGVLDGQLPRPRVRNGTVMPHPRVPQKFGRNRKPVDRGAILSTNWDRVKRAAPVVADVMDAFFGARKFAVRQARAVRDFFDS